MILSAPARPAHCRFRPQHPAGAALGHSDRPAGVCFSADGRLLASCGADGTIRVWDARRGHPLALLRGHKGRAWVVTLAGDSKTLAAGDEDGKLHFWDLSGLPRPR
jgi:WD40 repeat protein